jgi:hypothetical protein
MKQETKQKLRELNRDGVAIVQQAVKEKLKEFLVLAKDPAQIYLATVNLVLVGCLVVALWIWENPKINIIPDAIMSFWEKAIIFVLFTLLTILLFKYNQKFFSKAARGVNWQYKWKKK